MEVQPQLVLLQKTLLNIEGLGRQLYPDLDLWQTGAPVLREWMEERTGPKAMARRIRDELPEIRYMVDRLPVVARKLMDRIDQDEKPLGPDKAQLRRWARSRYLAFAGAVVVLAGAVLLGFGVQPAWTGWLLGAGGLGLLYTGRPDA